MRALFIGLLSTLTLPAHAEVVSATPDQYILRQEAVSPATPKVIWDRLVQPETWWHPDHTFSGASENLSLDLQAGGQWREDWTGGSVSHGTVLTVIYGEQLRLNAPFGPLQELAVETVWTITVSADETGGTIVTFDEIANGTDTSQLDELAPAVDYVKTEAMRRLVTIN